MRFEEHEIEVIDELAKKGPLWKGPKIDGVTQSMIGEILQCPFRAYLSLILGLDEPAPEPPIKPDITYYNLLWGDCYHVGLEHLVATHDRSLASKKMMERFYSHPEMKHDSIETADSLCHMLNQYPLSLVKEYGPFKTEVIFDVNIGGTRFRGKADGVSDESLCLLEHKCKGYVSYDTVVDELDHDLQVNLYAGIFGTESVIYDLIKIPDVQHPYSLPRKGVRETKGDYTAGLYYGEYHKKVSFPIKYHVGDWIQQIYRIIPRSSVDSYWDFTIYPIVDWIHRWYEIVSQPDFKVYDPKCYGYMFYQFPLRTFMPNNTDRFKCKFHSVITGGTTIEELSSRKLFAEL